MLWLLRENFWRNLHFFHFCSRPSNINSPLYDAKQASSTDFRPQPSVTPSLFVASLSGGGGDIFPSLNSVLLRNIPAVNCGTHFKKSSPSRKYFFP